MHIEFIVTSHNSVYFLIQSDKLHRKKIDIQLIILQQPNKMLKTPYAFEFYFTLFLKIISNLFQFFYNKNTSSFISTQYK